MFTNNFLQELTIEELQNRMNDITFVESYLTEFNSLNNRFMDKTYSKNDIKKLISSYMIFYHKNYVLTDNDLYCEKIYNLARNFIMSLEDYKTNTDFKGFQKLQEDTIKYLKFFDIWKERDSLIISRPLMKSYNILKHMVDELRNTKVETDEEKKLKKIRYKEFRENLKSIRKKIFTISGKTGLELLDKGELPVFPDENVFLETEKTVKKAFWDVFEENIKEKKYETLIQILRDLKEKIFSLSGKIIQTEFNNSLDIDLLETMIDNEKDLSKDLLKNISMILISFLERMQAPEDDQRTRDFKEVILIKLENEEEEKLLRFFFENIFTSFEKIEKQILSLSRNLEQ